MSVRTFNFKFKVDGVLTNATSAKLSDATATFGAKRTDTGETVVADGVDLVNVGTGLYRYSLTEPAEGLTYEFHPEIVYDGETFRFERTSEPPATSDVTAAEMVTAIKTALRNNPIGIVSVTVDGQMVQYSRSQALEELKLWQREAAREAGTRPRVARIRLDRF